MKQKSFAQALSLILVIGGLLFIVQPTQAGFFDWLSWSKIKSIFTEEKIQENLPASLQKPIEENPSPESPSQEPIPETSTIVEKQCPVCPSSQPCQSKEIVREVIKEVPKEVVVYKDFKDDPTYKANFDVFNKCKEGLKAYEKGYDLLQQELASSTEQIKELQTDYITLFNSYKFLKSSAYSLIDKIKGAGSLTTRITSQQISNSLFFDIQSYNYAVFTQGQLFQPVYDSDSIVSSTQAIIDGFK